jgi:hypothetical protein
MRCLWVVAVVQVGRCPALPSSCSIRRDKHRRPSKQALGSRYPCRSCSSGIRERTVQECSPHRTAQPPLAAQQAKPFPAVRRIGPAVSFAVLRLKARRMRVCVLDHNAGQPVDRSILREMSLVPSARALFLERNWAATIFQECAIPPFRRKAERTGRGTLCFGKLWGGCCWRVTTLPSAPSPGPAYLPCASPGWSR